MAKILQPNGQPAETKLDSEPVTIGGTPMRVFKEMSPYPERELAQVGGVIFAAAGGENKIYQGILEVALTQTMMSFNGWNTSINALCKEVRSLRKVIDTINERHEEIMLFKI